MKCTFLKEISTLFFLPLSLSFMNERFKEEKAKAKMEY